MLIIAGIFAVLGHNYTCWLKIQGRQRHRHDGRRLSCARAAGRWALRWGFSFWRLLLDADMFQSLPLSAAVALPAAVWMLPPHNLLLGIVTTALGALAIYKHKSQHPTAVQRHGTAVSAKKGNPGGDEMKITVLGAGAWGTALAKVLHENGNAVTLWDINAERWPNSSAGAAKGICPA